MSFYFKDNLFILVTHNINILMFTNYLIPRGGIHTSLKLHFKSSVDKIMEQKMQRFMIRRIFTFLIWIKLHSAYNTEIMRYIRVCEIFDSKFYHNSYLDQVKGFENIHMNVFKSFSILLLKFISNILSSCFKSYFKCCIS